MAFNIALTLNLLFRLSCLISSTPLKLLTRGLSHDPSFDYTQVTPENGYTPVPSYEHPAEDTYITADEEIFLVCETTGGSPQAEHVDHAASTLQSYPLTNDYCSPPQHQDCVVSQRYETAAIGACGNHEPGIKCGSMGAWAKYVVEKCEWEGLAGGKVVFKDRRLMVYVFHTRDS